MKKILVFSFSLIAVLGFCFSEERSETQAYNIINSNSFNMYELEHGKFTRLEGAVHFFYGEIEFFCDTAELTENTQEARLFGNVKVIDDTLTIESKKLYYNHENQYLEVEIDAVLTQYLPDKQKRVFKADKIMYNKAKSTVVAKENVYAFDTTENSNLTSGFLHYDLIKEYGYLLKKPVAVIEQSDTLTIKAQKIEVFKEKQKLAANFDVIVTGRQFEITSDFLLYFKQQEKAVFAGEPKFTSNFFDAYAKQFALLFEKDKMKKAELRDSCSVYFANAENKEKLNTVTATEIDIYFENDKVSKCFAKTNVKTFINAKKEKERFKNSANGDSLNISFTEKQKLTNLQMNGRVNGSYKFYNKSIDKTSKNP